MKDLLLSLGSDTPNREYFYLSMQTACIAIIFVWIWMLGIKLRYQKYGYYYIFIRFVFYKDNVPLKWLREHKLFIYYAIQILSLLFTNVGLILQIKDETIYDKPIILFMGNLLMGISVVQTIRYLTEYVTFLENRNFDEHILDLHRKMRRLKQIKDKRDNGTV